MRNGGLEGKELFAESAALPLFAFLAPCQNSLLLITG